ncbi:MAG: trigger factor, partial [Lachnospira sp.]|nr:trigger factor [Lachnospira sp.]
MSFKVEQLEEKNMVKLVIEASAEEFEAGLNAAYNKNKNKISVPGFRKGKAPRKMIEQLYGSQIFFEDAANEIIPDAYADAAKESGLDIVSQPKVSIEQLEAGKPFIFAAEVAVRPEVELGEYKGVEVTKADAEVTDADVEEELKKVQDQNSRTVSVEDRAVKDGDMTVIDFEGFIDGEAFEGGKGENYPLTIGSHSFIDTFEEQMIGMNIGEEKELNVTFPEDYHAENLKGKPATFKVTVKEIKEKQLPELDDDFAQDVSDFDTLAEYKDDLKKKIAERKESEAKAKKESEAIEKVVEAAKMDIPQAMIDTQVNRMLEDFAMRLQQQGLSVEQYFQYTGMTADKIMEEMKPEAVKRIKNSLVLEAVAKAENIEVSEEEFEAELQKMADMYKMEIEKIKEFMQDAEAKQMKDDIAIQKAVELIVSS